MSLDRLAHLLELQSDASLERGQVIAQRERIVTEADRDGRSDFTEAEDVAFRALTERIATIDALIAERDAKIEDLAPLCGMKPVTVAEDPDAVRRAAVAHLFLAWKEVAPRKRGIPPAEKQEQHLTLAQARAVASIDS